jgi:multiple antibiotic resistance protein
MPPPFTEFLLASFASFFVTVNPIQSAALFAALTETGESAYRRHTAVKSVTVAAGLLAVFALFGDDVLRFIGISLAGVRVGGGILLMLVSIDIVFGRSIAPPSRPGGSGPAGAGDIAVFPLATPIIAGPGAITAVTVRASEANNAIVTTALLLFVLGIVMLLTLGALLAAATIRRWLGDTGMSVVIRVLGILLTALSAEMILRGLKDSGVFLH